MNGRVYDPLTAQFLSPDPYVQAPDNWLNYNRYAYAMNNPLMYTDPTGEWTKQDPGIWEFVIDEDMLWQRDAADWAMYEQGYYYLDANGDFRYYDSYDGSDTYVYLTQPVMGFREHQPYEPLDNYENIVNGYDPAVGGYSYMGEVGESIGDFASEAQYFVPVWGSTAMASESLREGDFLNFGLYYGMAFFEAFTLGYGSGLTQGAKATALAAALAPARTGAKMLKPLGLGSTGRTAAANLTEQMAMQEIMSNPTMGQIIQRMKPLTDVRWTGWRKMQYIHEGLDGSQAVIHYNGKWANGILEAVDDFKFK